VPTYRRLVVTVTKVGVIVRYTKKVIGEKTKAGVIFDSR
jgi:hypothetical protein